LTSNAEAGGVADTSVVIALTLGGHARHRSAVEVHRRYAPVLPLLTSDQWAVATYQALGVDVIMVE